MPCPFRLGERLREGLQGYVEVLRLKGRKRCPKDGMRGRKAYLRASSKSLSKSQLAVVGSIMDPTLPCFHPEMIQLFTEPETN
jgi:hypothetical protein